ncbi:hypothetical protein WJX84_001955 [Apatococcus fuscideae]|uniref:LIM zinc-binding domain-containing protein n=1 Tax=Apatococcus fuscideae TaxID=2026836 RepID=A0AAW1SX67_9CHLO
MHLWGSLSYTRPASSWETHSIGAGTPPSYRLPNRSIGLDSATTRAEVMACSVVDSEERACRICLSRVGSIMFDVYHQWVLACFKCFKEL